MADTLSIVDNIVHTLAGMIVRGEHAAGTKLPSERKLAETFQAGRPQVREALGQLMRMRLVRVKQGSGAEVLHFWNEAGLEALPYIASNLPELAPQILNQLMHARKLLAAEIVTQFAQGTTDNPAKVADLKAWYALQPKESRQEILDCDYALFAEMNRISANLVFGLILNATYGMYETHRDFLAALLPSNEATLDFHRRLFEVLETGGPKSQSEARELAEHYLDFSGLDH